jgi:hypothetical protein
MTGMTIPTNLRSTAKSISNNSIEHAASRIVRFNHAREEPSSRGCQKHRPTSRGEGFPLQMPPHSLSRKLITSEVVIG